MLVFVVLRADSWSFYRHCEAYVCGYIPRQVQGYALGVARAGGSCAQSAESKSVRGKLHVGPRSMRLSSRPTPCKSILGFYNPRLCDPIYVLNTAPA